MQEFDASVLSDTFAQLVFYHKLFAGFFALPFVLNLIVLFTSSKNLVAMNKRIWFITPIIFFLLSVSILSGINVWLFGDIGLNVGIIAMITFCMFVIVGEVFRLRILKVARRTNVEAMMSYVKFCKILYSVDLVLFALLFFLA